MDILKDELIIKQQLSGFIADCVVDTLEDIKKIDGQIIKFKHHIIPELCDYIRRVKRHNKYILVYNDDDYNCRIIQNKICFYDNRGLYIRSELPKNILYVAVNGVMNEHPKLGALPLGLINDKIYGVLKKYQNTPNEGMILSAFNPWTYWERQIWWKHLQKKQWLTFYHEPCTCKHSPCEHKSQEDYWVDLAKHRMSICPRGMGLDSYRFWESLYLGCVPIVSNNATSRFFSKYLPVVIIDDWFEVDPEEIIDKYNTVMSKEYDMKVLTKSWWRDKVRERLAKP